MKFYERLEHWAFLLRSKALYFELKYYVKKKQTHIKRLHLNNRGIGKTYNLMKISGKYKIPVVEPTFKMAEQASINFKDLNPIVITPKQLRGVLRGVIYHPIILIDEMQLMNDKDKEEIARYVHIGFGIDN